MVSPEGDPEQQEDIMINVTKRIVGLSHISENLCGKTLTKQFQTQSFVSQRQTIVVRRVFPYHIILCVNRPCSERAAVRMVDYIT